MYRLKQVPRTLFWTIFWFFVPMSPLFISIFDMVQDRSPFVTREVEINGITSDVVDYSKVIDLLFWGFWYLPFCLLFAFLALLATWPKRQRNKKGSIAAEK